MTSPIDRPDHGKPDDDRDPRGDRSPVHHDLVHPDAQDDRDRVIPGNDPVGALPHESVCALAAILARAFVKTQLKAISRREAEMKANRIRNMESKK